MIKLQRIVEEKARENMLTKKEYVTQFLKVSYPTYLNVLSQKHECFLTTISKICDNLDVKYSDELFKDEELTKND